MTKQEKIDLAYKNINAKNLHPRENGYSVINSNSEYNKDLVEIHTESCTDIYPNDSERKVLIPKELIGIYNNNGWVKIYCENDLPQFDCDCWWMDKKKGLILGKFLLEGSVDFIIKNATHYKIILRTELPIY